MFVQRNDLGQIVAVYESKQPGMAEESIEDNDPQVDEFFLRADEGGKYDSNN